MKKTLILTALSNEYSAVRKLLKDISEETLEDGTIIEKGIAQNCEDGEVYIRECGKGNTKAALSADKLIKHIQPDLTMFIGIAGGIKDLNIGDVLILSLIHI